MRRFAPVIVLGLSLGLFLPAFARAHDVVDRTATTRSATEREEARAAIPRPGLLGRLPLAFIENQGQVDPQAKFYLRTGGQTLWLTQQGIVFDLLRTKASVAESPHGTESDAANLAHRLQPHQELAQERLVFTQDLIDAHVSPTIEALDLQPGTYNYFLGNDPAKWRTGVRSYSGVVYRDVWDSIDLKLSGNGRNFEQEFIVKPRGDPTRIRVAYRGIDGLRVADDGSLLIKTAFGELREGVPRIYQEINGRRVAVRGRFKLLSATSYTFELDSYRPQYALVIDPTLVYSSYLGGSSFDAGLAVAVDALGNAYVTGETRSTNFPTTVGVLSNALSGIGNAFVTKMNAAGTAPVYSTYLGGSGQDQGTGIAVDANGNAYLVGTTSSTNFPVLENAPQTTFAGGPVDAFVAKLTPTGSSLFYSTYLGGSGSDVGFGIAVDASGRVYVTGETSSTNFPTANPLQATFGGGSFDAFVAKIDTTKSGVASLVYSTYLGGSDLDTGFGIAIDAAGSAYVTGQTFSSNFPTMGPFQTALNGSSDAFVTKIDTTKSGVASLVYSTYLGGGLGDLGVGIAVDAAGSAYVTGSTTSTNFPTANPFQPASGGSNDAFIAKLTPTGSALLYSTYLGGSGSDGGEGIAVDGAGSAYVTGPTTSTNFPIANPFQPTSGGSSDAFIAKIDTTKSGAASLVYSTYLGGSGDDLGFGIAVDLNRNAYATGRTSSINFPTTAFTFAGATDAFIAKVSATPATAVRAYVTNANGNTVSVIDVATNAVVATVPVGTTPEGVAVTPDGTLVYVTNTLDDTVSVIDAATNTVTATVVVGSRPFGVAVTPNGTRVYVANELSNAVSVISTATNTVTATVLVGLDPRGVALTPDGTRVYVANFNSNTVSVISTATNTVTATVPVGPGPIGVAATPDGARVYVANQTSNTVSVISTATNTVIATVPVGGPTAEPAGGVAVTPDGTRVYVAPGPSSTVSVISTATNTVTATVPVGTTPGGLAVTPDGTRVYVPNIGSSTVSVISIATNTVTATVPVGNGPIAFGQFIGIVPLPTTAGTTSFARSTTSIVASSSAGQPLGVLEIDENAVGVLSATGRVTLQLPANVTFATPPRVSLIDSFGMTLGAMQLDSAQQASFAVLTPSSGGAAKLQVSGISVVAGAVSGAVSVSVGGTNPGITPASVPLASVCVAPSVCLSPTQTPGSAGQGAIGQTLTLTGANFAAGATVSFSSAGITVTGVTVDPSGTSLTVTFNVAPTASVGASDITVTNPGGQSATLAGGLTVKSAPTIAGTDRVGTNAFILNCRFQKINLQGTNFESPTPVPLRALQVFINTASGSPDPAMAVGAVSFTSPTAISAVVDVGTAATGSRTVTVINPDGGRGTSVLTVVDVGSTQVCPGSPPTGGLPAPSSTSSGTATAPTITSLSATQGLISSSVTLTGTGYSSTFSVDSVTFAGANNTRVPALVTAATGTQVSVTVPTNAVDGPLTVAVNGLTSNGVNFTVTNPRLAGVIPGTGQQGTTVSLDLTGTKFASGMTVQFVGATGITPNPATVSTVTDPTHVQLPVTLGSTASTGTFDVKVTNPDTGTSTLAQAFKVTPPILASFTFAVAGADPSLYLPSVDAVSVTLDATGKCTAKTVTPHAVTLVATFAPAPNVIAPPPASATVTFTSVSNLPGTTTNEDCELGPTPAKDFSFSATDPTVQQVSVPANGSTYQTTLFSWDWGGTVTIQVSGITTVNGVSQTVSSTLTLPVDTDGDGLPDAWETNLINVDASGKLVLNRLNPDQNANCVLDGFAVAIPGCTPAPPTTPPPPDRFALDGLGNFPKYRGVYLTGPAAGTAGAMTNQTRLGAGMRHLFVRGRGFGNDPAVTSGTCGMNVDPTTGAVGAPAADSTLSATNPCPPFEVGNAFALAGVQVHDVTASFSANGATGFPRQSLMTPATAILDMATVVYDATNCYGGEICTPPHTSKYGVRQWSFPTLGFSGFGAASTYGVSTSVFKKPVDAYFNDKAYQHRENKTANGVTAFVLAPSPAPPRTPMLAPITIVGDSSNLGADNGLIDSKEALGTDGQLLGDTYIPGSFGPTSTPPTALTVMDVNNDGCVELPFVADPSAIAWGCDRTLVTLSATSPQAHKRQVVRSLATHELGHAVGVNTHTSDPSDIMYMYSNNWTRDGHFSTTATGLLQIHNAGQQ